jgi:enoyl-CoA hydratase/carnithine racemase
LIAAAPFSTQVLRREQIDGGVALLTLNRPAARNSLSYALLAELSSALASVDADSAVHAVILAAEGPAFCAGHDLKELTARRDDVDGGRAFFEKVWGQCATMMQMIVGLPQPVIACVNGAATAAGCQLVASCDLAVACDSAVFSTPGVNIGLFCSSPMVALSRNMAPKHALEMLLTGEMISAAQALRTGLINRVVTDGEERAAAFALARQIAAKSAAAIRLGKQAFHTQMAMTLGDAYRYTSRVMVENMLNPDAKEGIGAFLAKRRPEWGNR